ncbi:MAG TPA: hypothetical protein ENN39_11630 [Desulfonatronum sp.]|nr:hypothetical protein [Desulfonatronum sp.]
MGIIWEQAFSQAPGIVWQDPWTVSKLPSLKSLDELRYFLDVVHIKFCLIKPYFETANYPVVEARELLPSFDVDIFEYQHLPGFSLVAVARPLSYFHEVFQFDILHPLVDHPEEMEGSVCPLEANVMRQNQLAFQNRLPRQMHDEFQYYFSERDITDLEHYIRILSFLVHMERGHVLSKTNRKDFIFSGINASFPSDLDTELKRFGLRIGKFRVGDDPCYELNRNFVYQFLMELYGFPIVSERRTSAALFARRLFKLGEEFLIRVLGQSDRTLTTLFAHPQTKAYPRVDKTALVRLDEDQTDLINRLGDMGAFVDEQERVIILRVAYRQHKYDQNNVRQDRALSVLRQEIIHPLTGEVCCEANVIKDISNMLLKLNDIIKGEFTGKIRFKKTELVENTDTHEKRLKFLFAWLCKHQRRIIGYSDEFYSGVIKVLDGYLLNPENHDIFKSMQALYNDVWSQYSFIRQARRVRILEDLTLRSSRSRAVSWLDMLQQMNNHLQEMKFEIYPYFDELVRKMIALGDRVLHNSYLNKRYMQGKDEEASAYAIRVKKQYRRLVGLVDELKNIRKQRPEAGESVAAKGEAKQ